MMVPLSSLILLLFSCYSADGFHINRLQSFQTHCNMASTSKITTAESARFNVLTEIERQQQETTPRYGRFMEHRQRLKEMGLTNNAATGGLSKRREKMAMFHISSSFDDVKAADNTNINDKFWRAALKLGTVVKGLEGFPIVPEKFGPFTEPAPSPGSNWFCMTLTFTPFFVVRYWYEPIETTTAAANTKSNSKTNTNIDSKQTVFFREFQWIFFQKLVYNRLINREEIWSTLHDDIDFVVTDVRNGNFEKDGNYDRIIVFKQV